MIWKEDEWHLRMDAEALPEGSTVVIRSHGVGKKVYDHLEEYGLSTMWM